MNDGKELKLPPRLRKIAALVPHGARLADIGTDHGYLPAALLRAGRIERALATDINAGPLANAQRTAEDYGVDSKRLSLRLCDGLSGVAPEEADTIVIAGMGGETMISILSDASWTRGGAHRLILQPMTKLPELRRWLSENGYMLTAEHLVSERGTYYVVMEVNAGNGEPLSEADCFAGCAFGKDPLYGAYLERLDKKLARQESGLSRMQRESGDAQLSHVRALRAQLREKRKEWEHDEGV